VKVAFIGLGKLGLPCALAAEAAGHDVRGYDTSPLVAEILKSRELPYVEKGAQELLSHTRIKQDDPARLAEWADLAFIAVQTPHQPKYEGVTRLPETREDFDYGYLADAVQSVKGAKLVVVISTVLPGTMDRFDKLGYLHVNELTDRADRLIYNPSFIAMGTTIPDFRDPEFVLVGTDGAHPGPLREFYSKLHEQPLFVTDIKTAELTKVAYNTFIGLKIAFANTMMDLCEKTGADVDDLVDALSLGNKRIISPTYLRGGMGDGGGCHPRDNIALSWLAREHNLSYDLFDALMVCRERQTDWLAELIEEEGGDVEIMGKAYKPNTALTVGSPATLLANILTERNISFIHTDPLADV
jgi:UDPglucose 6-dehydrogenase